MKLFSLIFKGNLHLARRKKVIPAKEFSTLVTAEEVLIQAKEDSENYRKETAELRQKTLEEAKNEGREEGLLLYNEAILKFDQQLKKLRHDTMQMVLPLALKAAKKIVAKELEQFPETIVEIVLKTIAPFTQNQRITIYVPKGEKELLEANRPRLKEVLEQVQVLNIAERENIAPGGCIIETETGIINAGIDNQWRSLEAAFERYKKSGYSGLI